jgi:pyruvate-ferredoxin/flavodoxin oxidoreductase
MKQFQAHRRKYNLFDYYGAAMPIRYRQMGSGCEAAERPSIFNARGHKSGLVKVSLYRPFDTKKFNGSHSEDGKYITVLDRTKEPGSIGEPSTSMSAPALAGKNTKVGGRYGMGTRNSNPINDAAVYAHGRENKNHFSVGIFDDVSLRPFRQGIHRRIPQWAA